MAKLDAPIRDPFFQGQPFNPLTDTWARFLKAIGARPIPEYLTGTRAQRADYDASRYADGSLYYETDTTLHYRAVGGEWVFASGTMRDVWADRPTGLTANDDGLLFYATDRTILYRADGGALKYESGTYRNTHPNILGGLGSDDTGTRFHATDYLRTWRWTGSAWEYAEGERPSKEIIWYPGSVPSGWALCNGGAVTVTNSAATTSSFPTPNLVGKYLKGGTYTGATEPAVAPGATGSTTDPGGAHTHTGVTAAGTTGAPSINQSGQSGAGITSATNLHTHSIPSLGLIVDAAADHTHDITSLTIDDTGEPTHVLMLPIVKL